MNYKTSKEMNRPEQSFKAGGVRASVWRYEETSRNGQPFTRRKVSVERTFKASDGTWKSTSNLEPNDVPKAILVLFRAYTFLQENPSDSNGFSVKEEYIQG